MFPRGHRGIAQLVEQWSPKPRAVSSILTAPAKKKRQFSSEDCRFFVLITFLFSFFSILLNCRFQRKDKREEIKEKVALLLKALNYIIISDII